MRLKNKTNKDSCCGGNWQHCLHSLHLGLSGFSFRSLSCPPQALGLAWGGCWGQITPCPHLSCRNAAPPSRRAAAQGNIHHLSGKVVEKKKLAFIASEMVCLPPLGLGERRTLPFWVTGVRKVSQDYYKGKTDWANILICSPISRCPRESGNGASYNCGYYPKNTELCGRCLNTLSHLISQYFCVIDITFYTHFTNEDSETDKYS